MKRLLIVPIALLLSACTQAQLAGVVGGAAGIPPAITTAATTAPCDNSIKVLKASYGAEAIYNVPAAAYRSANTRGLLSASVKAMVKPKLVKLYGLLKDERAACDAVTIGDKIAVMTRLRDQILPLIPK